MSKTSKNILISLVCIIFSVLFMAFVIPAQIPLPKFSGGGTTPRAIPRVCCVLIIVMAVLVLWRSFVIEKGSLGQLCRELIQTLKDKKGWRTFGGVMGLFAVSAIYYAAYCIIGFFLATLILFPIYAMILGCRKPITIAITDVVLACAIYYFFAIGMGCYLPGWAPF